MTNKNILHCRKAIVSNWKSEKWLFMPVGDIMLSVWSDISLDDWVWTIVRYADEYKDMPM